MKDIYVGIYIRDNEIETVIADTEKDAIIKQMKDLADEIFTENLDKAYVYCNDNLVWSYD